MIYYFVMLEWLLNQTVELERNTTSKSLIYIYLTIQTKFSTAAIQSFELSMNLEKIN